MHEEDKLNNRRSLSDNRNCCKYNKCLYNIIPSNIENTLIQCTKGCYFRYHNFDKKSQLNCFQKMIIEYKQINKNCYLRHNSNCINNKCT